MNGNYLRLCRICISTNSNSDMNEMISIFDQDLLWRKLATLADVEVKKDDSLPQFVCVSCAESLVSACLLKEKCEIADRYFRQQFLLSKTSDGDDEPITLCDDGPDGRGNSASPPGYHCDEAGRSVHMHRKNDSDAEMEGACPESGTDEDGAKNVFGVEPTFNFNSIQMMHEYMQHQLSRIKPDHAFHAATSVGSISDVGPDDDDPLPLIPEIELITPSDDMPTALADGGVAAKIGETGELLEPGYQCFSCFEMFSMKSELKAHMQSVHGTAYPEYECSNCNKTYFYKRFLEKHIRRGRCGKRRRNQTRPMQCSDCHVLFPTGHHLGWHKRTGCPARAAKMPLQQLFKQNIVQHNNFPRRVGPLKAETAIYLTNRKSSVGGANKTKGRTRIKLDAKKIALAKQLILREATTSVIAQELHISRTFAWRLRKSLMNGISLHERLVDGNGQVEEREDRDAPAQSADGNRTDSQPAMPKAIELQAECLDMSGIKVEDYQTVQTEPAARIAYDRAKNSSPFAYQSNDELVTGSGFAHNADAARDVELICKKSAMYEQQHSAYSHILPAQETAINGRSVGLPESPMHGEKNRFLPLLSQFSPALSAAINQLPVNLSIRPVGPAVTIPTATVGQLKKPRKPNVFIDNEKYTLAKTLVAQNSSTMQIARALNVSQMTAWKVRDAIVKGIPLSYRNNRDAYGQERAQSATDAAEGHDLLPQMQQHQHQQHQRQHQPQHHQPQHQQQQPQLSQQSEQQEHHHHQQQVLEEPYQAQQQQQQEQEQQQQQQQQQEQEQLTEKSTSLSRILSTRRRLKAAEREVRDKEVTREILELIQEDSNIQYWKVSARLAEKGITISPSSVCQKLKSMGIHRRMKPGDKSSRAATDQLKALTNSSISIKKDEQHFDLSGAHFLSAFTR